MNIYKDMYYFLFNAVTDAIKDLPKQADIAKIRLGLAQIKCEKMFIECKDEADEEI